MVILHSVPVKGTYIVPSEVIKEAIYEELYKKSKTTHGHYTDAFCIT